MIEEVPFVGEATGATPIFFLTLVAVFRKSVAAHARQIIFCISLIWQKYYHLFESSHWSVHQLKSAVRHLFWHVQ